MLVVFENTVQSLCYEAGDVFNPELRSLPLERDFSFSKVETERNEILTLGLPQSIRNLADRSQKYS